MEVLCGVSHEMVEEVMLQSLRQADKGKVQNMRAVMFTLPGVTHDDGFHGVHVCVPGNHILPDEDLASFHWSLLGPEHPLASLKVQVHCICNICRHHLLILLIALMM